MKSRTSFFNKTVFKKDLTRFAPLWGGCTILMLLVLVSTANVDEAFFRLQNVQDFIPIMSWLYLFYAAAAAQLLFGDLFNSRMCNALHALPVRRECWFGTHIISGVAFSLIPNLVITLLALPALRLESGWPAIFWWLLASELQYIFFFGIAVLCVMLTGNRLGQLALYTIIQFGGLLAYWMADAIYEPFLHGILIAEDPFMMVCPLGRINDGINVLAVDSERIENALGELECYRIYGVAPDEGWGYLAICAAVGILALAGALALYRKRKLECAGDFVAFSAMEPVVTALVTLFCGGFFHLFADAFGMNLRSVMLGAGMVIGFFACRMLLERTTRVFRKKAFLGCGAIVVVFGLTVLLTYLDPIGITRYIPAAEDVESITFSRSHTLYYHQDFPYVATEAEDIQAILHVHEEGIRTRSDAHPDYTDEAYAEVNVRLEYKLKNGKTVNRFYSIQPTSEAGQILKNYFTTVECVLGVPADQARSLASCILSLYTAGREETQYDVESLDLEGLMDAIVADCEAGNMAQTSAYHYPRNYDLLGTKDDTYDMYDMNVAYLEIGFDEKLLEKELEYGTGTVSRIAYRGLTVYRSCVNTLKWLEDHDLLQEDAQRKYADEFITWTTG